VPPFPSRSDPERSPRYRLALLSIFLLAAVLRCSFPEVTWFSMDQTRDIAAARGILHGKLVAEGPAIGQTGIALGPLHYYVTAAGLAARDNPVDAYVLLALLHAAGVVGYAVLFRRMLPGGAAIAAALVLAVHPLSVLHARALWNPALILPTTALYLNGLWRWSEEKNSRGALLMLLGAALMLQAHVTTALLLPLMLRGVVRRAPLLAAGPMLGTVLFLALTLPWLGPALGAFFERTTGLTDLEGLSPMRSRTGGESAPYGLAVLRALALERVTTARTLFGGAAWNRAVEIGGYVFSGLVLLGAAATVAGREYRRRLAWWLVPILVLPSVVVPLMRNFAYYYYLELTLPVRAGLGVIGAIWLGRYSARWAGGLLLAVAVGLGLLHLLGGLARDRATGLLRGRLAYMDLRGQWGEDLPPNMFPTLASKKTVGRALGERLGIGLEQLRRSGRGPWWLSFVDDGGFWMREGRGAREPVPWRGLLFIGHEGDPFPVPAASGSHPAVRAGAFRLVPFQSRVAARLLEIGIRAENGGVLWTALPADLGALPVGPGGVNWPAAEVALRARLEVPNPPPPRLVIYFLGTRGARATRLRVDGEALEMRHDWKRLGVEFQGHEWIGPGPGSHTVLVDVQGPEDRTVSVYFELFEVQPRQPPARGGE